MKELSVPIVLLGILFSLIVPLPSGVIDFLLAGNLILAFIVLLSTLYISNPIKFSALPSLLLLTTLFRLALNISTTRLILGSGETGQMIQVFGSIVIRGEIVVGAVIFLIITLVQFIVIAKGSERVAEVAARFTLDALPGKQMSIDADMRSGVIDVATAKRQREDLQTESRFYGALDGAMKFVKGDAIAGIVITVINIIGGFLVGTISHDIDLGTAFTRYTMLTVGDGLLSQIPALLNSLAAGMVVTRVARSDGASLSSDLISQLGQVKRVKVIIAIVSLVLGFSIGPIAPFLIIAIFLAYSAAITKEESSEEMQAKSNTNLEPTNLAVLQIEFGSDLAGQMSQELAATLINNLKEFQQDLYAETGIFPNLPEIGIEEKLENKFCIRLRGVSLTEEELAGEGKEIDIPQRVLFRLKSVLKDKHRELIDDTLTRKLLDKLEERSPEIVTNTIPDIVTVTQLTKIIRTLVDEKISCRNLDMILQAIAEHGSTVSGERELYEFVRCNLARLISDKYAVNNVIEVISIDPMLDIEISGFEQRCEPISQDVLHSIRCFLEEKSSIDFPLLCSRRSRRLLGESLVLCAVRAECIAYEEIAPGYKTEIKESINFIREEGMEEVYESANS